MAKVLLSILSLLVLHLFSSNLVKTSLAKEQQLRPDASWFIRHTNWPHIGPETELKLPDCCSTGECHQDNLHWFEGIRQRRKLLVGHSGRLFNGCATFYRKGNLLHLRLRKRLLLNHCGRHTTSDLSLTCLASPLNTNHKHSPMSSANDSTVSRSTRMFAHTLQLLDDSRCPPGTARDAFGLCRRCYRMSPPRLAKTSGIVDFGDCWQPRWNAVRCPRCVAQEAGANGDDESSTAQLAEHEIVKESRDNFRALRRWRRAVNAFARRANISHLRRDRVAQLGCPNRFSLVATFVCLSEMQQPIKCEVMSMLVVSFTVATFLSMPLYVGYVLMQIMAARFVPYVQFHVYMRSALLCSAMRTQAIFAPSLWDFVAFREAEKRRRLEQQDLFQQNQKCDFSKRELSSLLLWSGFSDDAK